jgi:hypothetical protein
VVNANERVQDRSVQSLSNGVARPRVHRLRRKRGVRVVRIEVTKMEIETLAELGYMESDLRRDVAAT